MIIYHKWLNLKTKQEASFHDLLLSVKLKQTVGNKFISISGKWRIYVSVNFCGKVICWDVKLWVCERVCSYRTLFLVFWKCPITFQFQKVFLPLWQELFQAISIDRGPCQFSCHCSARTCTALFCRLCSGQRLLSCQLALVSLCGRVLSDSSDLLCLGTQGAGSVWKFIFTQNCT